jgi:hypothetical protein
MDGTTFSGLSTRTTMGNTLRSLAYTWYYAEQAGVAHPWASDQMFVMASGDDVVLFCDPAIKDALVNSVMRLTARTKDEQTPTGLGQCLKTIELGEVHEISFCSKWFYSEDGTLDGLTYSRDVMKILTQKQYYSKSN